MEPEKLLADYHARVAGIAERAQAARAQIASVRGNATSADGAVTVSVNVQGALEELSFGPSADTMALPELARAILQTSRRARSHATTAGADALVPLIGVDSAAMSQVRAHLPGDSSLEDDVDHRTRIGLDEEESKAAPHSSTSARPRPHIVDDADDSAGG
ncbi:MAG TPA: YbaB/EbfC family nucleoid-associated protein [Jatrophihabitantaceae bacterium]|nr:YbaB/EbfC family nucleoid-associated protein [Jatrophihabitantaceae bacterium]